MGGTLAMIVRKPNGEVVPMLRWTNPTPYYLGNVDFLTGNFDKWWTEFSDSWNEMAADYEKHKEDKQFELNMTPCYFPCEAAAPDGYGLVVVDWKDKKVYSMQGYTSYGAEQSYRWFHNDEDQWAQFAEKEKLGFLGKFHYDVYDEEKKELTEHVLDTTGPFYAGRLTQFAKDMSEIRYREKVGAAFNKLWRCKVGHLGGYFPFVTDWKFIRYEEDRPSLDQYLADLKAAGFEFNEKDLKQWNEFYEEDEDEEDDDVHSQTENPA